MAKPYTAVSGLMARFRCGRWISFAAPESPTVFFRPYLHGLFVTATTSKLLVRVLAGPHAGDYWIEKADSKRSSASAALMSYAPLSDTEALVLGEKLKADEVELLGQMLDDGRMSETHQSGDILSNPVVAAAATVVGALAVAYIKK